MKKHQHLEDLTTIARWCRSQYVGIVTAKTRKQVKLPEYLIVSCRDCSVLTLQKKRPRAGPTPCQDMQVTKYKTRSTSRPRTKICGGEVSIVREIGDLV